MSLRGIRPDAWVGRSVLPELDRGRPSGISDPTCRETAAGARQAVLRRINSPCSVARPSRRDPRLCEPASRRGCLYRSVGRADGPNAPDGPDGGVGLNCSQIQAAVNTQYQQGEGVGAGAGAAQSLDVDQNQVLACFGTAAAAQQRARSTSTCKALFRPAAALPLALVALLPLLRAVRSPTPVGRLIALGAGALLVAGGLFARRISR